MENLSSRDIRLHGMDDLLADLKDAKKATFSASKTAETEWWSHSGRRRWKMHRMYKKLHKMAIEQENMYCYMLLARRDEDS